MNGTIYKLTSPSGKAYVGQTVDLERRMATYRNGGSHEQPALHNAIEKYGWKAMRVSVIACGIESQDALDTAEVAAIEKHRTLSPHGYNLRTGGMGGRPSAETRARQSESARKISPETRAKMRAAMQGVPKSPEHRAKLSAAKRGERNPNFGKQGHRLGKTHTAATREKMRAARGVTPEMIRQARALHARGMSYRAVGREVGVGHNTVMRWVETAQK